MKWIFALLLLFSVNSFAVESTAAGEKDSVSPSAISACYIRDHNGNLIHQGSVTASGCYSLLESYRNVFGNGSYMAFVSYTSKPDFTVKSNPTAYATFKHSASAQTNVYSVQFINASLASSKIYFCPPSSKPEFTIGPVVVNAVNVCQRPPKVCMMGAIVRIASDGKETCVSNCSAASGLIKTSQFYYQAGPDVGSTAGQVQCYGQCAVQTSGSFAQLSNGAYTGTFAFTGANCPVVRPEPTVDSESNTGGNGDAPAVDESTTSDGTESALGELGSAASSATSTQVEPSVTGPDGTATTKDVAQTIADAANAQIKATSAQNVAFGNLMSNISSDIQNATIKSGVGGGGASSSLQAQGNSKLGEISDKLGEISDKLDDETEELTFTPPNAANPFWENVLPQSSFDSISAQKDSAIEEFKELQQNFRQSLFTSDITASGEKPTFDLSFNSASFNAGSFIFDTISTAGIYSIIILIAMMTALYIIMNRSK